MKSDTATKPGHHVNVGPNITRATIAQLFCLTLFSAAVVKHGFAKAALNWMTLLFVLQIELISIVLG